MNVPPNLRAVKIPASCEACKFFTFEICKKYNVVVSSHIICDSYEGY